MIDDAEGIDPYIQSQITAMSAPAVIKIGYLNFRSKYPEGLVVAVEGNDDKVVYSFWIDRALPDLKFEFFVCNGKRRVRQLRNSLANDQSETNCDLVFLVDRDFDDLNGFISNEHVFMLDKYSIENYLLDTHVLNGVIRDAFPGSSNHASREAICRLFEEDCKNFLMHSREINWRIFVARKLSIEIDDIMPNSLTKVAHINLGNIESCSVPPELVIPYQTQPPADIIKSFRHEFDAFDPKSRYRGKFLFKFLSKWLSLLNDEFKNPTLNLFAHWEVTEGRAKPDEWSLGSLACRSRLPTGFEAFFKSL